MKTIIDLANDLADLRVMAARGQCVTSDEVADAYKALEKAIAAARCQALEEAAKVCETAVCTDYEKIKFMGDSAHYIACRDAIRALIGGSK